MTTKSRKSFILDAKQVHGDLYGYGRIKYINDATNVEILCKTHGLFWQTPNSHLRGSGCRECGNNRKKQKFSKPKETFLKEMHELYKNTLDFSKSVYKNDGTKLEVLCPLHGSFYKTPGILLTGAGCNDCRIENNISTRREEFIRRSNIVHSGYYDYSKVNYVNSNTKVEIVCKKHGSFFQLPRTHLNAKGTCIRCAKHGGVSKVSECWILDVEKKLRIKIQSHSSGGEYKIPYIDKDGKNRIFKVDGFNKRSNTVFEFLGDYFHGNPKFKRLSKLSVGGEKRSVLYKQTIQRLQTLERLGFNIKVVWENDYRNGSLFSDRFWEKRR